MTTAIVPGRDVGTDRVARGVPWASVVLPCAVLLALANEFWVVTLRTSVGAIERTSDPALSWVRESVELLPVYVVAVVAALGLAGRWFGDRPRGRVPVLGTIALVAVAAAAAGGVIMAVSAVYDYQLQVQALIHHSEVHLTCVGACLDARENASMALELRAVGVGILLLLLTDVVLVAWAVALRGRAINPSTYRTGRTTRTRSDDLVTALVLLLAGAAVVHAAVIPEHLEEWKSAGVFFVCVTAAQLAGAVLVRTRRERAVLAMVAAGSAGLLVLWAWSRTVGMPFGPEAWEPEAVGLADIASGLLELATVVVCLALLRSHAEPHSSARRRSPHLRGIVVAGIVAVTVLGIGGSSLPGVGLVPGVSGHGEEETT